MSLFERFQKFQQAQAAAKPLVDSLTEKVLLVDGLNTYIRYFAATPTMNDDGEHAGGITGFLRGIAYMISVFKPSRVVVVFDGPGGSHRRRTIFPDYKGKRRTMTKLNRTYDFQTLEQEKESQKWQLMVLASLLNCLPVTVMTIDLVEADDTIAYLASLISERGNKAIILSTDKDFLQLVDENVSIWNPVKKKLYTPDSVLEDYKFHPSNFLLYRTVTGDNSDCIPGVEGIKEKTLLKFFPELATSEKQSLDLLMESATKQLADKKKAPVALQAFVNSQELLERNLRLMRLDEVAMSGTTKMEALKQFESPPNEYNKLQLTKILQSHKLMSAFPGYETWLQTSFVPLTRYKLNRDK
jgi:DNA polymerase I